MRILSISIILIFGLSALGLASQLWGIGYDPDSIIYEDVAENWMAGDGVARFDFSTGEAYPMTNFPPLYPLVLGLLSQIFGTVADSARFLNTVLWGGVWLMVYAWIRRGHQSHKIAWCFATLLMVNLMVFQVFGTSWSEPLFIILSLSGLWFILKYNEAWQWRTLIIASSLFACAILTRYAGVALVMTAGVVILRASSRTWRERLQSLIGLGLISGLPLMLWLIRNVSVRGDVANRDVLFTLIGLPEAESLIRTIGTWLIPVPELSLNIILVVLAGLLLLATFIATRKHPSPSTIENQIFAWWIIIYMTFIILSFSFLDRRIPFNYRILLPAYIGLIIFIGRYIASHWTELPKILQLIWIISGLILIIINSILGLNWAVIINRIGQQYSHSQFQKSQIIQDLRDTPLSGVVYTNNNFLYHYLTNSPAYLLPPASDTNFEDWLKSLANDKPIQIVFFSYLSQREWESTEQIESLLPLTLITGSDVVTLYQLEMLNE